VLAPAQKAPVFGIVFTWELARAGVWTLGALIAVVLAVTLLTESACQALSQALQKTRKV